MRILPALFTCSWLALMLLIAPPVSAQTTDTPKTIEPQLQIPIPGLDFKGSVLFGGEEGTQDCEAGQVCVDTVGRYMNAILRYMVGAGALMTIVLIMIGGVEYMLGSATGSVSRATARMKNAAMGLLLTVTAATILLFINPDLGSFGSLSIDVPKGEPDVAQRTERSFNDNTQVYVGAVAEDGKPLNLRQIIGSDGSSGDDFAFLGSNALAIQEEAQIQLQVVAALIHDGSPNVPGSRVLVTRAWEDPVRAARLFYDRCLKDGTECATTCNPFPAGNGSPVTLSGNGQYALSSSFTEQVKSAPGTEEYDSEIRDLLGTYMKQQTSWSCPYTTGYAVDVFCQNGKQGYTVDAKCTYRLETLMQLHNFCRSKAVPWRYEFKGKAVTKDGIDCDWQPGLLYSEDLSQTFDYKAACAESTFSPLVNLLSSVQWQSCGMATNEARDGIR